MAFFRPAKAIFVPGMYCQRSVRLVGAGVPSSCRSVSRVEIEIDARVLEVLEERVIGPGDALPGCVSAAAHTSTHFTFASVYEKPSTWPVLRPKRP